MSVPRPVSATTTTTVIISSIGAQAPPKSILGQLYDAYLQALIRRPIYTKTLTAAVVTAAGNYTAQIMFNPPGKPVDQVAVGRFITISLVLR